MSFMLIRFMQQFTGVTLDEAAAPPHAKPPAHWKNSVGRKTIERVYPKSHLTMYAQVSDPCSGLMSCMADWTRIGGTVGQNDRSRA